MEFKLLIGFIVLFSLLGVSTASAEDIYVNDTGWWVGSFNDSSAPIQDAVDNAGEGDTIIVKDGTYEENVNVNKRLTIRSENGSANCIVDGDGSGDVFTLNEDGITIEGFTVRNSGSSGIDSGIKVVSNNNDITNNTVSDNYAGIFVKDFNNNNTIINNTVLSSDYFGIYLRYSNNNTITDNAMTGDGIVLWGRSIENWNTHTMEDNSVNGKPLLYYKDMVGGDVNESNNPGQVILANCTGMTVEDLSINNTDIGVLLGFSSQNTITNNSLTNNIDGIYVGYESNNTMVTNNNASNNDRIGIHLFYANNNTFTKNNVSNNGVDGNYRDGIYLGYSSNNTITDNTISSNDYYGIQIMDLSNNNIIAENNVSKNKEGLYLGDSSNDNHITNNTISFNGDTGIHINLSSNNHITNNSLSNNKDGIHLDSSSNNHIINNTISSNDDDGIHLDSSSNNHIINNTISSNDDDGIFSYFSDYSYITNNTIFDNDYHGIYLWYSSDNAVTNNTMRDDGVTIWGKSIGNWNTHTIEDNTVNDKPLLYYKDEADVDINASSDAGQVILANCTGMTVEDLSINNTDIGVLLGFSSQNTITNNSLTNNHDGIYVGYESNNTIVTNNNASNNNRIGIHLMHSSSNTITNNNASNNGNHGITPMDGIYLKYSNYNNVTDNIVSFNYDYGIELMNSSNNDVADNTLSNNLWDFLLNNSTSNVFTNNTLAGDHPTTVSFTYSGDISLKGVSSSSTPSDPDSHQDIGKYVKATKQSNVAWLFLNISYSDADLSGIDDESTLKIWKHNGTWYEDGWNGSRMLDTNNKIVGVNITSFSVFAPLGASNISDTTPPDSVSNLGNITYQPTYINWTWTDPPDDDFDRVEVYLNGDYEDDVSAGGEHFNATDLSPSTVYELGTRTVDDSGNIGEWVNDTAITAPAPDTTPPAAVSNLQSTTGNFWINWTWNNPLDDDFNHTMIYLDGVWRINTSDNFYNATGFQNGTAHNISTCTVDGSGNVNETWVNDTAITAPDTTPPASITSLQNTTYQPDYINWTWSNPVDDDFNHTMIYLDGVWRTNTSNEYYLATNLTPDTSYNISIHTVDTAGNVNQSWVNDTASTAPNSTETTPTPTPTPEPRRSSGGGGGGGGGGLFLPTPTPTPTATPNETSSGSNPSIPSTPEETPTSTSTPNPSPTETPTSTPTPQTTPTPFWQQPTVTITIAAFIVAAIVVLAYAFMRK